MMPLARPRPLGSQQCITASASHWFRHRRGRTSSGPIRADTRAKGRRTPTMTAPSTPSNGTKTRWPHLGVTLAPHCQQPLAQLEKSVWPRTSIDEVEANFPE